MKIQLENIKNWNFLITTTVMCCAAAAASCD